MHGRPALDRPPLLHSSHPSFESTLVLQVLSLSGASERQPGFLPFTFWWVSFSVALLKCSNDISSPWSFLSEISVPPHPPVLPILMRVSHTDPCHSLGLWVRDGGDHFPVGSWLSLQSAAHSKRLWMGDWQPSAGAHIWFSSCLPRTRFTFSFLLFLAFEFL